MTALIAALLLAAPARPPLVAVLEFNSTLKGAERDELDRAYFSDRVRRAALKALPGVRLMTRENMKMIAQARGVDLEKCEGLCEVEIGQKLDADDVISGDLRKLAGEFRLTLKLYDVAGAQLLSSEEAEGARPADLLKDVDRATRELLAPLQKSAPAAAPEAACDSAQDCVDKARGPFAADRYDEAFPLARKACALHHAQGCSMTGYMHSQGKGTAKDPVAALAEFLEACAVDDGGSCYNAAHFFHAGEGTAVDLARAATLKVKACDLGDADGCLSAGTAYDDGKGVSKDEARGAEYFRLACDKGRPFACARLAYDYLTGSGVPQDKAKAHELSAKACEQGNGPGCTYLAHNYRDGVAVPADAALARKYLARACELGEADACAEAKAR